MKQSYSTKSRRYSTRSHKPVHSMSRNLESVRRGKKYVHWSVAGASLLEKGSVRVRERNCVDGVGLFDGNVRMVFMKSVFVGTGFCLRYDTCDRASDVIREPNVERCVKREYRPDKDSESGVQRKLLHSFLHMRVETDGRKEVGAGRG